MLVQPIVKQVFGIVFLLGCCACFAQQNSIPWKQIQQDTLLSSQRVAAGLDLFNAASSAPESIAGLSSSAALPPAPSPAPSSPSPASSSVVLKRVPAERAPRTLDAKFVWLNTLQLSLALADVEMTQRCIDNRTCREGNPLMPSSEAGRFAVSIGLAAYTTTGGYWLKKHDSHVWWLAPVAGIAAHTAGLVSGLAR